MRKLKEMVNIGEKNNMETKEIKINCPEGYEIDIENSTFECIKFKKKEEPKNYPKEGYYIDINSNIKFVKDLIGSKNRDKNIYATEKHAKSALAMAQISQIIANDERFGGFVKELDFGDTCARRFWQIQRIKFKPKKPYIAINQVDALYNYSILTFYKPEQANLFLKENKDLVKDFLMLDDDTEIHKF